MSKKVTQEAVDFSIPARAFIKKYSSNMIGAEKFALLVAYLAKGDESKAISLPEIQNEWNRMTELLGGKFNRAYTVRVRDNDWVNAEKTGSYHLRPSWKSIFE